MAKRIITKRIGEVLLERGIIDRKKLEEGLAYQKAHGVPREQAYNSTMYLMAAVLLIGLTCNLLVRAVDSRWHHPEGNA